MAKKLHRSPNQSVLGGVCGGIAEYFDLDPVIIRILFLIAILSAGVGLLAYFLLWIIVPQRPLHDVRTDENYSDSKNSFDSNQTSHSNNFKRILGLALVIIGGITLLDNLAPFVDLDYAWPILLIFAGSYLILDKNKSSNQEKEGYEVY